MSKIKIGLFVAFLLLFTSFVKAQINSPYSRFGVGNLNPDYPVELAGYGGLSAASEGPTMLNYANPASFASLQLTTFSFGVYGSLYSLSSPPPNQTSQSFQDGTLTNLCLGFPIVKGHWGASFGLMPYSREGYSIANLSSTSSNLNPNNTSLANIPYYNSFDDTGNLYKFYVGNAVQIRLDTFDRINIGISASYLFGTFSQSDDLAFVDTFNSYNSQHMETKTIGGIVLQEGVQYIKGLKSGARLVFGAYGNLQSNVSGRVTNIWDRFVFQDVGNGGIKDTINGTYNSKGAMVMPASINVGIVYDDPTHFTLGVNYDYTYWSKFSSFGDTGIVPLTNSWRAAIGGQWLPDFKDYHHYWKIVKYNLGFYYEKTDLQFNSGSAGSITGPYTGVDQFAVTMGVSLPLTKGPLYTRYSVLNFAVEMGQRGFLSKNPLREQYITFSLGLTLNDLWFVKRKFD